MRTFGLHVPTFVSLLSLKLALTCLDGDCRIFMFPSFFFFTDKRLVNHTIRTEQVPDLDVCEFICYQEPNCVSINFNIQANADGAFSCELNNATHRRHDDEFMNKAGYLYRGTDSACDVAHCHNNGICQSGFTEKRYRCLCPFGFTGKHCENDVDECATDPHSCSNDAVCHNTKGSYHCTCKPGYIGDESDCTDVDECATQTHSCSNDAICYNTKGSYDCAYKPGYTGDGSNCTDKDECEEEIHNCVTDDKCINSKGSYRCTVPEPVAFFPLNASYGTKEINNKVSQGISKMVNLAPGPNVKVNGSYEFSGTSKSYIEFPNIAGGPLDVRHSITMLCWLYHGGQDGPIFNYRTNGSWGVHLWVLRGKLFVRFNKRDYVFTTPLHHTPIAGEWKLVGGSYDRVSGEARLWVDGVMVQTLNIGARLELATQDSVRMGVKSGDGRYFKGRISQMQVYDEALTLGQIQTIQRQTPYEVLAHNCKDIKERGDSQGDGIYWLDPDGGSSNNEFPAYCDMTSYNGGWTMCYTTDEYAKPKSEVIYSDQSPYGKNGYRTNCNNIQFTEIMFVDHQTGNKTYFKRKDNLAITAAEKYGKTGGAHGLWEGKGTDDTYKYQLLICDHSFYSGFFVSGYTAGCFKQCHSWCGDVNSPYFRTASTNLYYKGVAFNTNGHYPNMETNRLISVGMR